jgi:hypothetical protein
MKPIALLAGAATAFAINSLAPAKPAASPAPSTIAVAVSPDRLTLRRHAARPVRRAWGRS